MYIYVHIYLYKYTYTYTYVCGKRATSQMNETYHTHTHGMPYVRKRHVTCTNPPCHTYKCVRSSSMSHMQMRHMSQVWRSCFFLAAVLTSYHTYIHTYKCAKSCIHMHTYTSGMSHIRMRHITHMTQLRLPRRCTLYTVAAYRCGDARRGISYRCIHGNSFCLHVRRV